MPLSPTASSVACSSQITLISDVTVMSAMSGLSFPVVSRGSDVNALLLLASTFLFLMARLDKMKLPPSPPEDAVKSVSSV